MAALATYEPAIRAGWLLPISRRRTWKKNEEPIWAQVRRDVADHPSNNY